MALPARQQQILDVIDRELSAADPQLAAAFRSLGGGAGCPQGPWRLPRSLPEQPGRLRRAGGWLRGRTRLAALLPAAVLAVLGAVTMSLSGPQGRPCGQPAGPASPVGSTAQPVMPPPPGTAAAGPRRAAAGLPAVRCLPGRHGGRPQGRYSRVP